jgi:ubiquitin-protein ligase
MESFRDRPAAGSFHECLVPERGRKWLPAFDSTSTPYSCVGELIASTKRDDVSTIKRLDASGVSPLGGMGKAWAIPSIASRLFRELKIACTWAKWISIVPMSDNINDCLASMEGPVDTPYEGGVFWLHVEFPPRYPFEPPLMRFLTKIYHPNISPEGHVCVDVLAEKWTPVLTVSALLASVHLVLSQPEWDDPIDASIAKGFKEDQAAFFRTAKQWTERYATQERPGLFGFGAL